MLLLASAFGREPKSLVREAIEDFRTESEKSGAEIQFGKLEKKCLTNDSKSDILYKLSARAANLSDKIRE